MRRLIETSILLLSFLLGTVHPSAGSTLEKPVASSRVVLATFHGELIQGKRAVEAFCWVMPGGGGKDPLPPRLCFLHVANAGWQRTDDDNFANPLRNAVQAEKIFASWTARFGMTLEDKHQQAIRLLLGGAVVPSAEDIKKRLEGATPTPPKWIESIEPYDFTLGEKEFESEKTFIAKIGAEVVDWARRPAPPTDETKTPPKPLAEPPAKHSHRGGYSEVLFQIAGLRSILEEVHTVLVALVVSLLVCLTLVFGYVMSRLTPLIREWWGTSKSDRATPGQPEDEGTKKLCDVLSREGESPEANVAEAACQLILDVRERLAKIAGADFKECPIKTAVLKVEANLSSIAQVAAQAQFVNTAQAENIFRGTQGLLNKLSILINQIPVKEVEPVESWIDADAAGRIQKRFEAITERIRLYDSVCGILRQVGYEDAQVVDAAENAAVLLQEMVDNFSTKGARFDFAIAASKLSKFLEELRKLATPSSPGLYVSDLEGGILSLLELRLKAGDEAEARADNLLSERNELAGKMNALGGSLETQRREHEDLSEVAERLVQEQVEAATLLSVIPGLDGDTLPTSISELVRRIDIAAGRIRQELSGSPKPIDDAVDELIMNYKKSHALLSEHLALGRQFCGYLHLQTEGLDQGEGPGRIAALLKSEAMTAHRSLRLGLASGLASWSRGVEKLNQADRRNILQVLEISSVEEELNRLLISIESAPNGDLGIKLEIGFKRNWLHGLFRAEALLDTYFAEQTSCAVLREAVSQTSGVLRIALESFDCRVQRIDLLAVNTKLPGDVRRSLDASPEFRQIGEVRERVRPLLSKDHKDIVIDVRSFVWFKGESQRWSGEVVGINRGEWLADGGN